MISYKGYQAATSFDHEPVRSLRDMEDDENRCPSIAHQPAFSDQAEVFHGEVIGTREVIFFEATSVEELKREFRFSIDDYLVMCAERGQAPDKPFSGKIPLRTSPEVHRAATAAAKADGKSLNAWLAAVVERAV